MRGSRTPPTARRYCIPEIVRRSHTIPWYVTASVVATAVIAVAAIPVALWATARSLGRSTEFVPVLAASLVLWLTSTSILALLGAYRPRAGIPGTAIALVVAVGLSTAAVRRVRSLTELLREPAAQPVLIWLQLWRLDGLAVLVLWWQGLLPALFAVPAGVGDLLIGITAPIVAANLHRRRLAIAWNVAGLAVLVGAVALAIMTTQGSFGMFASDTSSTAMTLFPMAIVPTFLVTLSNALHLASLHFLLSNRGGGQQR
jgi:hypothetical protein